MLVEDGMCIAQPFSLPWGPCCTQDCVATFQHFHRSWLSVSNLPRTELWSLTGPCSWGLFLLRAIQMLCFASDSHKVRCCSWGPNSLLFIPIHQGLIGFQLLSPLLPLSLGPPLARIAFLLGPCHLAHS